MIMHSDPLLNPPAPRFSLLDQEGKKHSSDDYHGQWYMIYFYPKDDTPGCTKQACNLRDDFSALKNRHISVLGISLDSIQQHASFADKHQLPFPLLADQDGHIARAYQALFSLGPLKLAKRHSFLIDPEGVIRAVFRQVKAGQHSQQILQTFDQLK